MVNVNGIHSKGRCKIKYPTIPSVTLPHGKRSEIPAISHEINDCQTDSYEGSSASIYSEEAATSTPQLFTQNDLDEITRKMKLTKSNAQFLCSTLK